MKTLLKDYDNSWYNPKAGLLKRMCWYFANLLFFNNGFWPFSGLRVILLRVFGAKVGKGVFIKPCINIKYPWLLDIGDYVWIGEGVWIDNLARVKIGSNVCVSQGAMLLTGNHNYRKSTFDLMTGEIVLKEGTWIGARAVVCPGVTCESHSMLTVGSVATGNLAPYSIYSGNAAIKVKDRKIIG